MYSRRTDKKSVASFDVTHRQIILPVQWNSFFVLVFRH